MTEQTEQATGTQDAKNVEHSSDKMVPLKEVIAQREARRNAETKVAELQALIDEAEASKLGEVEKLKRDNEKLQKQLTQHVQSLRRSQALEKAMSEIGEGFHIDEKQMPSVRKLVDAISFDEKTIDDIAKEVVEAAKRPKSAAIGHGPLKGMPVAGEFGKPTVQPQPMSIIGQGMTPYALATLAQTDPEKYAETLADLQTGKQRFAY